MNELPPVARNQRLVDANHLKVLSIFHFVGAGLAAVGLLFLVAHYAMFHTFMANPKIWENQKQSPPPAEFFAMFKWFYVIFAAWFVASGILSLLSGLFIRVKKHRAFSTFVAGINCLHIPLGTVLGVFTIIVLTRDSVGKIYEESRSMESELKAKI